MSRSYNPTTSRTREYTLREFIRNGAAFGAGQITWNKFGKSEYNGWLKPSAGSMPTITLGSFEVSRLILGSNPFWGFWHGNPRKPENYTYEGCMMVMDTAAELGITAIWVPGYKEWIELWKEYKGKGGKLETWIGQPDGYKEVSVEDQIIACARNGGKALCIQGLNVDEAMEKKDFEKLKRWIGMIKDYGLPAGLASHNPDNILKAEEVGLPAEFYHLTLGIPDTFESTARDRSLEIVRQIEKPMVESLLYFDGDTSLVVAGINKAKATVFKHTKDGVQHENSNH